MRKTKFLSNVLATILLVLPLSSKSLQAQIAAVLEVGSFSKALPGQDLPEGWKPLTFQNIEKKTQYRLVKDGDTVVVKAVSVASASGLIRELKIDPKEFPILQWRWKIGNILQKGNVKTSEGDDYPARIYIAFEYDPKKLNFFEKTKYNTYRILYGQYPPLRAINYIWESTAPKGTAVPNPYASRVLMIVVESGPEKINQWISQERNVFEDYQKAFGEDPPMISGVALMTDTDNTGESAMAYYGDISFRKGGSKND
jgi:hypothetical protein